MVSTYVGLGALLGLPKGHHSHARGGEPAAGYEASLSSEYSARLDHMFLARSPMLSSRRDNMIIRGGVHRFD